MCDEFEEYHEEEYTFVLKKGTILYSGNTMKKEIVSLKDIFNYIGQRGKVVKKTNYVLYASQDFNVAWGYAASCQRHGYIHKFVVTKDVVLLRGDIFEDSELVDKCICTPYDYKGFAVIYDEKTKKDEYALCNSEEFLEYVSSIRCIFDKETWIDITLEEYAEDVGIAAGDLVDVGIEEIEN